MDSSNRLAHILNPPPAIDLHTLTESDVFTLFETLIGHVHGSMKYLPGLKPIEERLNCWIGGSARRTTPIQPTFPDGVSEKTKVLSITGLEEASTDFVYICKELLVTETGKILLWTSEYDLRVVSNFGDKGQTARLSDFTEITREKFESFSGQRFAWKWSWNKMVIRALRMVLTEFERCVDEREERLKQTKYSRDLLAGPLSRIKGDRDS